MESAAGGELCTQHARGGIYNLFGPTQEDLEEIDHVA